MTDDLEDSERRRIAGRRLVDWYRRFSRDLPWRGCRDPYGVWVSEIMLQQTTVRAVTGRWEAFMARFPSAAALARAPIDDVLSNVQGLGYYRRFRSLHAAARLVVERHGGEVPRDRTALADLPGLGEYTVGAILSIAWNQPAPAVDGNVIRVVTRLEALPMNGKSASERRSIADIVTELGADVAPREFTQALFDLGAGVCTPTNPRCDECPLTSHCRARALGTIAEHPSPQKAIEYVDRSVLVGAIRREGLLLLVRRPDDAERMPGFHELPEVWTDRVDDHEAVLAEHLVTTLGMKFRIGEIIGRARHSITHHRLECLLFDVEPVGGDPGVLGRDVEFAWLDPRIDPPSGMPISTITTKLLRSLGRAAPRHAGSPSRRAPRR